MRTRPVPFQPCAPQNVKSVRISPTQLSTPLPRVRFKANLCERSVRKPKTLTVMQPDRTERLGEERQRLINDLLLREREMKLRDS